jgi:hypothetical protein
MNSLEIIQTMVSPVFMVSGCAVLLSTSSNKSAAVIDRIRDLSEGKDPELASGQIRLLFKRLRQIRNAVFCFELAIGFFLMTSLVIGGLHFMHKVNLDGVSLALFLVGMACVLAGVVFLGMESKKAYEITQDFLEHIEG